MSRYEYTSPPTITIDGVWIPVEGVAVEALRRADQHTEAVTTVLGRRGFAGGPQRVEVAMTFADPAGLLDELMRMDEADARRAMRREMFGAAGRGCFHDGCPDAMEREGGERWCMFAEEMGR